MSSSEHGGLGLGLRRRAANWLRRVRQVASILGRFGFGSVMELLGLDRLVPRRWRGDAETAGIEPAVRLRLAMEELGPTAIKLGQALSSRADIVPLDIAQEMRKLQDEVPPVPFEQARGRGGAARERAGDAVRGVRDRKSVV